MALFALLAPRVADAPAPNIPTDHLERLELLTEQAVAGFLDGQNVIRLLGIGTAGTSFGLTGAEQVRETIARVRDWI